MFLALTSILVHSTQCPVHHQPWQWHPVEGTHSPARVGALDHATSTNDAAWAESYANGPLAWLVDSTCFLLSPVFWNVDATRHVNFESFWSEVMISETHESPNGLVTSTFFSSPMPVP